MRIEFEIKEQLAEIKTEILNSDKWCTSVIEERESLTRVLIKDLYFDSEASVEIWKAEIHIRTAWSNYIYRIYERDNSVWCEYIGAYRGLLEQVLLPRITPKQNILDSLVTESSLLLNEAETLLRYSEENVKQKKIRREMGEEESFLSDHPSVVQDEFIKRDVPIPSSYTSGTSS